jgi:hypothetical protein
VILIQDVVLPLQTHIPRADVKAMEPSVVTLQATGWDELILSCANPLIERVAAGEAVPIPTLPPEGATTIVPLVTLEVESMVRLPLATLEPYTIGAVLETDVPRVPVIDTLAG